MFVEKTKNEFDSMNEDEQNKYLVDKKAHDSMIRQKEILDAISEQKKISDSESKEVIERLENELKSVKDNLDEFSLKVQSITEQKNSKNMEKTILDSIVENIDKIKSVFKQGSGVVDIYTEKAVDIIATTNATNPDGIPELVGVQMANPSNVNLKAPSVVDMMNTVPTSLSAYPYTEVVPKDGDYAFVAEKGLKPQIDFAIETRYATPVKIAAYEHLTTESTQDIPNLMSIARDFLRKKHDLFKEKGLLNGDGLGVNAKGVTSYGRAFVAGSMANTLSVVNFMDVVNAGITDIFTTHNYQDETPYRANVVLVNPIDFFIKLVSAKDANGLPLYPTASLFNKVVLGGVTIMPHEDIAVGKIFIGDLTKYNITNYVGYTVRIGWINDDFIRNQFVMVGESRFHAFVKNLDKQAFIYDDIAVIEAALQIP